MEKTNNKKKKGLTAEEADKVFKEMFKKYPDIKNGMKDKKAPKGFIL